MIFSLIVEASRCSIDSQSPRESLSWYKTQRLLLQCSNVYGLNSPEIFARSNGLICMKQLAGVDKPSD